MTEASTAASRSGRILVVRSESTGPNGWIVGAAVLAGVHALTSLYWACGGRLGIRTVGGEIARMVNESAPGIGLLAWAAAIAKIIGMSLVLALTRPSSRRLPRRLITRLGAVGSVVLTAYGLANVVGGLLVVTGVVPATADTDHYALMWHLAWWDSSFLVWGLLWGMALWTRRKSVQPEPA